jgi:hypothetical protein
MSKYPCLEEKFENVVKLQHAWIKELQKYSVEPVLEQHFMNSRWLPVDFCGRLLWTRSVLPNELLFDFDFKTGLETSEKWVRQVVDKLHKLDIPHYLFCTGSKGFHISLFFTPEKDIDWQAARVAFFKYLKINRKYKIDPKKINFRKRSMVRIIGSKKEEGKYRKTYLPNEFEESYVVFRYSYPHIETYQYPDFLKDLLPSKADDDSCSISFFGRGFKGGDEKCFEILNKKFEVGERNNGLVSVVLLLKSTGMSDREVKQEAVEVFKDCELEVNERREESLNNIERMIDYLLKQDYHFSCKVFREMFPKYCDRCKSKERRSLVVE